MSRLGRGKADVKNVSPLLPDQRIIVGNKAEEIHPFGKLSQADGLWNIGGADHTRNSSLPNSKLVFHASEIFAREIFFLDDHVGTSRSLQSRQPRSERLVHGRGVVTV